MRATRGVPGVAGAPPAPVEDAVCSLPHPAHPAMRATAIMLADTILRLPDGPRMSIPSKVIHDGSGLV